MGKTAANTCGAALLTGQQLRKHGVAGVPSGVFGLKPDFFGLNIDQALGVAFQAQGFDVRIFNVFFALGGF